MEVFKNTLISTLDYWISNIYFKWLSIQLKEDVISIPNFDFGNNNTNFVVDEPEEDFDFNQNKYYSCYYFIYILLLWLLWYLKLWIIWNEQYLTKLKNILVFRDRYLLTKAHIIGIVVFLIKKENRLILGLDDGTEVTNWIMWTNDKKHKESGLSQFISEGNFKVGRSIAVLGQLECYNGQIQMNIQKVHSIDDTKDEMHQFYYHAIKTQKRLFDPFTKTTPNLYYRDLCWISPNNPDVLELLININKQHEDYIHTTQDIIFTENDLELEKEIERK